MAYFSNGTEGAMYQEHYCERCWHDRNQNCPIWLLHLNHNYEGANNPDHFLHALIPAAKYTDAGVEFQKCNFFIERHKVGDDASIPLKGQIALLPEERKFERAVPLFKEGVANG
jgi:hypothetical protein